MSRNLPYFKFFPSEWLNGDISLEDYELQGIFTNVIAYYWHKEGDLSLKQAKKKFKTDRITELHEEELIHIDENGNISIEFMDEQLDEFIDRKNKLSEAGKKGAQIKKAKGKKKPPLNHPQAIREDKDKEKEEEEEQEKEEDNNKTTSKVKPLDYEKLLEFYNDTFDKQCRIVNDKAKRQYNARLKEGYTRKHIINAMINAKNDDFNKEKDYKYCTIEYFSRSKTLDMFGHDVKKSNTQYHPR